MYKTHFFGASDQYNIEVGKIWNCSFYLINTTKDYFCVIYLTSLLILLWCYLDGRDHINNIFIINVVINTDTLTFIQFNEDIDYIDSISEAICNLNDEIIIIF